MDCPFCEPDYVLCENRDSRIIANIFPSQLGHILVIPKRHVEKIGEMSAEEWASLALAVKVAADVLGESMTDKMNLVLNQGQVAGQTIGHLHFNVIPRRANDNLVNFSRKDPKKNRISPLSLAFLKSVFENQ